jgi:transcriptional regulator with XRE-family HTH domain
MKNFGDTLRELRLAQGLGLRETALKVGISPAYLSRIERGKEAPPSPEVIRELAKKLASDPDVLFRLSSSTDPEIVSFMNSTPEVLRLVRFIQKTNFQSDDIKKLQLAAKRIKRQGEEKSKGVV